VFETALHQSDKKEYERQEKADFVLAERSQLEEWDWVVAARLAEAAEAEVREEMMVEEKRGLEAAERFQQEEEDSVFAARVKEALLTELAAEEERDAAIARELHERWAKEDSLLKQKSERQLTRDGALAMKQQVADAREFREALDRVTAKWRSPEITTKNIREGVVVLTCLPFLKGMRVSANSAGNELVVTAVPDFSPLTKHLEHLPETVAPPPDSLDIALDLRIVGKAECCSEDVQFSYERDTGKCRILVRDAFVEMETSPESGGFFAKLRTRLGSLFSKAPPTGLRDTATTNTRRSSSKTPRATDAVSGVEAMRL
jgi:NAD(P)-dependent dehydrogenase (short-subunit alcohol dehydrogenase family)